MMLCWEKGWYEGADLGNDSAAEEVVGPSEYITEDNDGEPQHRFYTQEDYEK